MEIKGVPFEVLDEQLIKFSKDWVIKNTMANYQEYDLFVTEAIVAHARAIGTLIMAKNERVLDWELEDTAATVRLILLSHCARLQKIIKNET